MNTKTLPCLVFSVFTLPSCSHAAPAQTPPLPAYTDVFSSGQNGYFAYRIPAIETAPDGALLAFAEARKHNLRDPGFPEQDIDLVLKRSQDNGKTWSPMILIEDPGELWSAANPATLVDRNTGQVWLFYLRCRPGRNTRTARPGTDDIQNLARHSEDQGLSWSEPVDLTGAARDGEDAAWRCSVPGPGGAIQSRSGRLLVPVWKVDPWGVLTLYSDDHGRSWHRGSLVPGNCPGNENQLVQLTDGSILMDFRQSAGPHRWQSTSHDDGQTWSEPRPGRALQPVACAMERYTPKPPGSTDHGVVWTGPKGPGRNDLVAIITIQARKPVESPLYKGPAAYSDLAILKDGTVGVLWERGVDRGYQFISFTRLDHSFLGADHFRRRTSR